MLRGSSSRCGRLNCLRKLFCSNQFVIFVQSNWYLVEVTAGWIGSCSDYVCGIGSWSVYSYQEKDAGSSPGSPAL